MQTIVEQPAIKVWKTLPNTMRSQGWIKAGSTNDRTMLKEIQRDLWTKGAKLVAFSRGDMDNVHYWTKA